MLHFFFEDHFHFQKKIHIYIHIMNNIKKFKQFIPLTSMKYITT